MTLRHRIRLVAITSALVVGGVAAVPVATTTVAAARPVIRNDALAGVAADALIDLTAYLANGDGSARIAYDGERHDIAAVVANRLGVDPAVLEHAWRSADDGHQQALMAALSQLGVPYHHNASAAGVAFDCSGLTSFAWSRAGVTIPHQSGSQISTIAARTATTAQAGDIVYYPGHAMMYLGIEGAIVHAPYTGRTVEVDFVSKSHHTVRYGNPIG
jgi:cell wall-associated NlpC family hydrolase